MNIFRGRKITKQGYNEKLSFGPAKMRAGLAFDFETYHAHRRRLVEERLLKLLEIAEPSRLYESMRYSVLSGGKRIRALLCLAAAEAFAGSSDSIADAQARALSCACAIEMIHAMSLIHDDLPCMDDDDFRRGSPSNHKVFGEALALLAGDALLVYANEILLKETPLSVDRQNLILVATKLSAASGAAGMVGGQVWDMEMTGMKEIPVAENERAALLNKIHKNKTGALISFSVWSGACLMGASAEALELMAEFGHLLGLSFQIADDLLDVTGDIKTLGKTPGKDLAAGKLTWVSLYGLDTARRKLDELEEKGKSLLTKTGLSESSLQPLRALLAYAIHRSH
ncbi:MAG: polyprenyl synthetase family protein [Candidatus Obscuribacterales bacterium]|nr:polyprenyl synthetase family protein [Candidatus Obscuribacterales bacterium]